MLRFALLVLFIPPLSASADTWTWPGTHQTSQLSREVLEQGVEDGLQMANRYLTRSFTQTTGRANLTIRVSNLAGYNTTMWFTPGTINIGKDLGGNRDTVRRTIMHELTHYFGINYHPYYYSHPHLRGNRVLDIGGGDSTWTELDIRALNTVGVGLRAGVVKPWDDVKWWKPAPPPTYPWTNPANPLDVDDNGQVTSRDALLIINAVGRGETWDEHRKPKYYYDVTSDKVVSSLDALKVINSLKTK